MSGEFELIRKLRQQLSEFFSLRVGPGDDAAVIDRPAGAALVFATDMLLDGVHFDLRTTDPRLIGRKALAVNLSDMAAMGAVPESAVVSVAIPAGSGIAEALHEGLFALAREFGVAIAGGDTNAWDGPLVVNVAITGLLAEGQPPLCRDGARPGDRIFLTGPCGGSLAGHHLTFTPRVRESLQLRDFVDVHAMIDVSDGLAADLHHILEESGVGAVLQAGSIPIRPNAEQGPLTPLEHALGDGEDFELLFTVSEADSHRLLQAPPAGLTPVCIGEIVETGCVLEFDDGTRRPLPPTGWQHEL